MLWSRPALPRSWSMPLLSCWGTRRTRPAATPTWWRRGRDLGHPVQRRRLPLGLLGEPGAAGDRVALPGPAGVAAGPDRADRGGQPVRGPGLHAAARRAGAGLLPQPL